MPYDLNHWIKIRQHKTTYAVNKWDSTKEIMKNYLSVKKKKKKEGTNKRSRQPYNRDMDILDIMGPSPSKGQECDQGSGASLI